MSEHTPPSRADDESTKASEQSTRTGYVERSDVGVSLTVKLTRGTGTRDQDKIVAKAKGKTMEDAREDMEILREYIRSRRGRSSDPTQGRRRVTERAVLSPQ